MKTVLCLLAVVVGDSLYAADLRGFAHFSAPDIVGAYCDEWRPLGFTNKGFNFSVGFYLNDAAESCPQKFWIDKETHALLEIDSISAVNRVISDAFEDEVSGNRAEDSHPALKGVRLLLSVQVASSGKSGLALNFDAHEDLVRVVSRLKTAGLDEATASLLLRLGGEYVVTENHSTKEWNAVWYEIDRLGGIERITVRGLLGPVRVVSVLHEVAFDAGRVNPTLLSRDHFFDVSLWR